MTGPTQAAYEAAATRIENLTQPGHDRECALAVFNQARMGPPATRLDEIQVEHLLAIGYRAGWVLARAATRAGVAEEIRAASTDWCMDGTGRHLIDNCVRIAEGGGQ